MQHPWGKTEEILLQGSHITTAVRSVKDMKKTITMKEEIMNTVDTTKEIKLAYEFDLGTIKFIAWIYEKGINAEWHCARVIGGELVGSVTTAKNLQDLKLQLAWELHSNGEGSSWK